MQKFRFFLLRAHARFLAFLFGSFSLFISLFFILFFWFFSFLVSFSFFFLFLTFSLSPQKRHKLIYRHCKIKGACKMTKFCYLYMINDDVFIKHFSILICNVYFSIFIFSSLKNVISFIICKVLFAKFIKTPNFCTLNILCAILFLHT